MPLIRRKYVQSTEEVPLPNGYYNGHTRSRYATIDHNNQQYKFTLDRVLFAQGYEMPTKFTVYNKTAYIGEIPLNFFSVNDTISNKVQVEKTNVNIGDLLKLKWSFISKLEKNPDWAAVASKLQKEVIITEPTQDPNVFICKFLKALKPVSVDLKKDVDWEDSQFTEYDKKYYRNKFEPYLKTELPDYLREDKDLYFGLDSRDFSNVTLNPTSDAARNLKPNDEFFITPKEDLRLDYGNVLLKNDKYRVKEIPDTKGGVRLRFVGGAVNNAYIPKNQFESRFGGKYIRTELPKVAEKADKSGVHLSTSYQRTKYEKMARVAKFKLIGYRLEEDRGKNGVFVDYICEIEKNPDKYAIIHPDGNYEIAYKENTRNIIPIGVPLQESKLFIENIQAMKKLTELFNEEFKPFTKKGEEDKDDSTNTSNFKPFTKKGEEDKKGLEEGDFGEVDNGMYAGNTVSGAFSAKNTPEKAPVMETKEKEIDGSTVKKKIRYKMTEDQKKMFDELRMIQESIKKLDGNRKLLY